MSSESGEGPGEMPTLLGQSGGWRTGFPGGVEAFGLGHKIELSGQTSGKLSRLSQR